MPETRGKTLEDIDASFRKKNGNIGDIELSGGGLMVGELESERGGVLSASEYGGRQDAAMVSTSII